jgi:hypothetical protein
LLASSCAVSKNFNLGAKYAPEQLQEDYRIFKNILEQEHPGLYWYTQKTAWIFYFTRGAGFLNDSLTKGISNGAELCGFKIYCGHTSVFPSKQWYRVHRQPAPAAVSAQPEAMAGYRRNNSQPEPPDSVVTRGCYPAFH